MNRGLVALAVWGSIQLFVIASLSSIFWRVQQIYRIVQRAERTCRNAVRDVRQVEAAMHGEGGPR